MEATYDGGGGRRQKKYKKMYKAPKFVKTSIEGLPTYDGETIEEKVRRVLNNKEAIKDGAPIIYQDRGEGVQPAYDIRTDRHEIAVEAMDKVARTKALSRAEILKELKGEKKKNEDKKIEDQSTQGTSESQSQEAVK